MKKWISVLIKLLPLVIFLPVSGAWVLAWQNLLVVYAGFVLCLWGAEKKRKEFGQVENFAFLGLLLILVVLRILSAVGVPGAIHVEGFFKNDAARMFFIIFSVVSILFLLISSISMFVVCKGFEVSQSCACVPVMVLLGWKIYFLVHAVCNSDFFNSVMRLEEMFVQKLF